MCIYLIVLILVVALSALAEKKTNILYSIVVAIPLIIVSGIRWNVGTDFGTYYYTFNKILSFPFSILISNSYGDFIPFERGFSILVWIIGVISKEPQVVIFFISVFNVGMVIYCLKKYSKSFTLSVYLYITMMVYFSAFNGMRQWIASIILFWAIKYIWNDNFIKYFICVILASTIHISALIMIPVYFIVKERPFGRKIFIIIILLIVVSMRLDSILDKFENITSGTRYESYTTINNEDDGVNIFRVLVAFIPIIMSFMYYMNYKNDKKMNILINFAMMNFLVLCLATKSTYISRFSMYFEIYNLLLYPKFINGLKKGQRSLFCTLVVICFFAYMCMLLPVDSNLLPYKTIFNK